MPTGPKGQKRPADVIGNAVRVMKLATGEIDEDTPIEDGKDPNGKALGAKGGLARAEMLSASRRKEIAQKAATTRWKKAKTDAVE